MSHQKRTYRIEFDPTQLKWITPLLPTFKVSSSEVEEPSTRKKFEVVILTATYPGGRTREVRKFPYDSDDDFVDMQVQLFGIDNQYPFFLSVPLVLHVASLLWPGGEFKVLRRLPSGFFLVQFTYLPRGRRFRPKSQQTQSPSSLIAGLVTSVNDLLRK